MPIKGYEEIQQNYKIKFSFIILKDHSMEFGKILEQIKEITCILLLA